MSPRAFQNASPDIPGIGGRFGSELVGGMPWKVQLNAIMQKMRNTLEKPNTLK